MSEVRHVDDGSFEASVLQADRPVLVDFWAPWCGPCRALAPTLDAVASKFDGKADVVKVNVDDNPSAAARYGIQSIPTLIVFHAGEPVERLVGLVPEERITRVLEATLASATV